MLKRFFMAMGFFILIYDTADASSFDLLDHESVTVAEDQLEVDKLLSIFFRNARAGVLFHPLSHLICNRADRSKALGGLYREYGRLERQYIRLGGKFLAADEQEIVTETHHYSCPPGGRSDALSWRNALRIETSQISMAKNLINKKRKFLSKTQMREAEL